MSNVIDKEWLRLMYAKTGTTPADFNRWALGCGVNLNNNEYNHLRKRDPIRISKGYALAYMAFFQYVAPTKRVFYVEPRKRKRRKVE